MENFYEHIDDYKNGTLKGELLLQFEAALKSDASLQLAVDNYDAAKEISEGLLEMDMLDTLEKLENNKANSVEAPKKNQSPQNINRSTTNIDRSEIQSNKTKGSIISIRNLMAAASLIGILFLAGWWATKSPYAYLDKEQVLASYVDPVNDDAKKSVTTEGMTSFEKGMHYYALNQYEVSEKWLYLAIKEEKEAKMQSQIYYWLGAAHLRQWEVGQAIAAWQKSDEQGAKEGLEMVMEK